MRFKAAVAFVASATCTLSSPASAQDDALVLSPASPWEMNYDDDTCALRRMFGETGNQVFLELRRFSPESRFQISVMGERLNSKSDPIQYRFEPSDTWQDGLSPFRARIGGGLEGYIFSGWIIPPPDDDQKPTPIVDPQQDVLVSEAFSKVSGISVSGGFTQSVTLKTGPLLAPHRAMQRCLDQMLVKWGLDAEAHKTLMRRAMPVNLEGVARGVQSHYPTTMLQQRKSGSIRVRLGVSDTGKVTECRIQLELSEPEFERASCQRLRGARFEPALDKGGRAIASYWTTSITYLVN